VAFVAGCGLASTLMRSLRLVATQTLTFLITDIGGWAAMCQWRGDAHAGVSAGRCRLIRAGLAAYGTVEALTWGDGVFAVFASPGPQVPVAVAHGG
jgi:class 3 adenylate cyclase